MLDNSNRDAAPQMHTAPRQPLCYSIFFTRFAPVNGDKRARCARVTRGAAGAANPRTFPRTKVLKVGSPTEFVGDRDLFQSK
jgi:hypothetical protein